MIKATLYIKAIHKLIMCELTCCRFANSIVYLFLTMQWVGLQCVIVSFPGYTHIFYLYFYCCYYCLFVQVVLVTHQHMAMSECQMNVILSSVKYSV